jgi:dinuclear metal center YbgI/SA1388 family protein
VPTLADLRGVLDAWFDPRWAEPWDAVGLVCGDPREDVTRVLLAVDAVPATVAEAVGRSAQLLITHHPLLLTGVHGVPADDPKGALVHRMIRSGVAHFVAHTNADVADPGVSDALARRLGLHEFTALDVQYDDDVAKLVVFVPQGSAETLIDAMAAAGAGTIGDYERCAWTVDGIGTFRPLDGAHPTIGTVGRTEVLGETRVEMIVPTARRGAVLAAMRAAHPYEEPAFDLLAQVPVPTRRGTGRIGTLAAPMSLREFTAHAAAALPATTWGVRAAGDPDKIVQTVAVSGGAGGSLAGIARRRGADVLLTADLKHHPTVEEVSERGANGIALVDAAHWATESPWLDEVAVRLRDHFGTSVDVSVSTRVTDPWTLHESSAGKAPASQ